MREEILVTILNTGKFKVKTVKGDWCTSINIGDITKSTGWGICGFVVGRDSITEYNQKGIVGFIILDNYYPQNPSELTFVEVDPKMDGSAKLIGKYMLPDYDRDDTSAKLTYNEKTEVFTINGKTFELSKLEKVRYE